MNRLRYVLSIDQGTSNTKSSIYTSDLQLVSFSEVNVPKLYPSEGYAEQAPEAVVESVVASVDAAIHAAGIPPEAVSCIGIANQGESVVAWDEATGRAVTNVILWQDRRGESVCAQLREIASPDEVRERTGLVLDSYFSAAKIAWLLKQLGIDEARSNSIRVGTMDSWLLRWMTGDRVFVTDYSTASRTLLFNIRDLSWDPRLCRLFGLQNWLPPKLASSAEVIGRTPPRGPLPVTAPVTCSICDQPASLLGHGCVTPGATKCTYGTGAFVSTYAGSEFPSVPKGLLTSLGWSRDRHVTYYVEGGVLFAGALIDWMLHTGDIVRDAESLHSPTGLHGSDRGVMFIPSLCGLGAPWWNPNVRGVIAGISPSTTAEDIVQAGLEGIAFRVRDIVDCMSRAMDRPLDQLRVDGGMTANASFMQFQADALGIPVVVAASPHVTSLGVAYLALQGAGACPSLCKLGGVGREVGPRQDRMSAEESYQKWHGLVNLLSGYTGREQVR